MDALVAQPACPSDGVVMRDHPKGYLCPECGFLVDHSAAYEAVVMPPEFDGPALEGF